MREIDSNGQTQIYMPRERSQAISKLAKLGLTAAENNWERAAMVATWVRTDSRGGRPSRNQRKSPEVRYTISEFTRLGLYGFKSDKSVRAYLRAWEMTGIEPVSPGEKYVLPAMDFPDLTGLYGSQEDDTPESAAEPLESGDAGEYAPEAAEEAEDGSPPRAARQREAARSMLDEFLRLLDKMDPSAVIHGQSPDRKELLIKTLESWLESLRETEGLD